MRRKGYGDAAPAFVGQLTPVFVRHVDPSTRLSARTRGYVPLMSSEAGSRRRRAGAPPPGNHSNFVVGKPALRVDDAFSFDTDESFVPALDGLGETDNAQLDAKDAVPWGFNLNSLDNANDLSNSNSLVQSPFDAIEEDETRDFTDDEDEPADEDDEEVEADEDEEILDELEQVEFEESDEDEALLSSKGVVLNEYEDELTGGSRAPSRSRSSKDDLSLTGMDIDTEDDVPDDDELVEMDAEKLEFDKVLATMARRKTATREPSSPSDLVADEELEDPSEAELQSAAELLTGSGILGLGSQLDLEERETQVSPADEILGEPLTSVEGEDTKAKSPELSFRGLDEEDEDEDNDIPVSPDLDDDRKQEQGLESYTDIEDDEEAEFSLTSKTEGSFGRVWELNEDTYVTITEPGQTYAYELDEEDSDDQEMASLRRGAQGGWGSGLQNDAKNKYEPGSREWMARRSYDLISKASSREMKLWTKRQGPPPPDINELYPDYSKPQAILGTVKLTQSLPKTSASIRAVGLSDDGKDGGERAEFGNDVLLGSAMATEKIGPSGNAQAQSALERAVKFPCSFKFKVEGYGEGLVDSLIADVHRVLRTTLSRSAFHEEPAGRYIRVVFAVEVSAARHVTDLYDAFRQNPLVKFSYG